MCEVEMLNTAKKIEDDPARHTTEGLNSINQWWEAKLPAAGRLTGGTL